MNPSSDRQAADLIRVFFASSHGVVAIMVGYGLALTASYIATHYQRIRPLALLLGTVMVLPALLTFKNGIASIIAGGVAYLPPRKLLLLFLCLAATLVLTAAAARWFAKVSQPSVSTANDCRLFHGLAAAALICFGLSVALGFFGDGGLTLAQACDGMVRVFAPKQSKLPVLAGLLMLGVTVTFLGGLLVYRQRAPLALTLGLFAMMPLGSGLAHWGLSEQRNHWFGYWFGHDMFTPPFTGLDGKLTYDPKLREQMMKDPEKSRFIYREMTRDAVVYGGTDPGRFNPTYMIFCESFIPDDCKSKQDQNFDRRDCYLITQNALADHTYLMYIRAQYNKSDQVKYDSPFFQEFLRGKTERELAYQTNFVARLANRLLDKPFLALGDHIEKQRRAGSSFFTESDFKDLSGFVTKLRLGGKPAALSNYLFENLSKPTKDLINGSGNESQLGRVLAEDLSALLEHELVSRKRLKELAGEKNALEGKLAATGALGKIQKRKEQVEKEISELGRIGPLYDAERFQGVELKETTRQFLAQNPQLHTRIRLNRLLLEEAYPEEIAVSPGGVYPDREILIATPRDSEKCFREYLDDVQRRMQMNPPQLKPGEDVKIVDNKIQVSGQVAVMSINALLTKVMFDKNPDHEFFIEESLPLDWMYPHLTPFGIIMKINRQPLPELAEDIVRRDHEFWATYSERLIGNWITYDTPVKDIVKFVETVYLRRDLSGFKGDPKFVRDDQAQKSFSKLRSSIGGVYAWRLGAQCPPEFRPKNAAEHERIRKEADFAFRQALAFCPYNLESVFRYVQLLTQFQRFDDALLIAETCLKLDPYNGQVAGLVQNLRGVSRQAAEFEQKRNTFQQLEAEVKNNPTNFQAAFNLAFMYMQVRQTDAAVGVLERVVNNPRVDSGAIVAVAQAYAQMGNVPGMEVALQKLVTLLPGEPEGWYDLAALKARLGKPAEGIEALRHCLENNTQRLARNPKAHDLRIAARTNTDFNPLRPMPEFQKLLSPL
jgi:tetratricopeptide (TPR) repeat protein